MQLFAVREQVALPWNFYIKDFEHFDYVELTLGFGLAGTLAWNVASEPSSILEFLGLA